MSEETQNKYSLIIQLDESVLKKQLEKMKKAGGSLMKSLGLDKLRGGGGLGVNNKDLIKSNTALIKSLTELNKHQKEVVAFQDETKKFRQVQEKYYEQVLKLTSIGTISHDTSKGPLAGFYGQREKDDQGAEGDPNADPLNLKRKQSMFSMFKDKIGNIKEAGGKLGDNKGIQMITGLLGKINMGIGGMFTGILSIVALLTTIVGSSEYLQEILKLLQTGIALIFRPIGDFIAMLLKPFIVLFLRQVVVPWIQYIYPLIKKFGAWWEATVMKFFENPLESLQGLADYLWNLISGGLTALKDGIIMGLSGLFSGITSGIKAAIKFVQDAWDAFVKWLTDGAKWVYEQVKKAWETFIQWVVDGATWIYDQIVKAWEGFVKWISDGATWIYNEIVKAWKGFIKWVEDGAKWIGEAIQTFIDHLSDAWGSFVDWIKKTGRDIYATLSKAWKSFVKWVTDGAMWISDELSKFGKWAYDALKRGWDIIVNFFEKLDIVSTLQRYWNATVSWFTSVYDTITSTLSKAWNGFASFIRSLDIVQTLKNAWDTFVTLLKDLWEKGAQIIQSIMNLFKGIFGNSEKTANEVNQSLATVSNIFNGIATMVSNELSKYWNGIVAWFSQMFASLSTELGQYWNGIINWFASIFASTSSELTPYWNGLVSWFSTLSTTISNVLSPAINNIGTTIASIGTQLQAYITNGLTGVETAFNSFIKSLENSFQGIGTSISNVFTNIVNWFNNLLSGGQSQTSSSGGSSSGQTTGSTSGDPRNDRNNGGSSSSSSGGGTSSADDWTEYNSESDAFRKYQNMKEVTRWEWQNMPLTYKENGVQSTQRVNNQFVTKYFVVPSLYNKWVKDGKPKRSGGNTGLPNDPYGGDKGTPTDTTGGDGSRPSGSTGGGSPDTTKVTYSPTYADVLSDGWTPLSTSDMRKYPYEKKFISYYRNPSVGTVSKAWFARADEHAEWKRAQNRINVISTSGGGSGGGSSGGSGAGAKPPGLSQAVWDATQRQTQGAPSQSYQKIQQQANVQIVMKVQKEQDVDKVVEQASQKMQEEFRRSSFGG